MFNILAKGSYYDSIEHEIKYLYIKDIHEDRNIYYGINSCLGVGLLSNVAKNFIINIQCGFSNAALNYKLGADRYWASIEFATFFQISAGYSFNKNKSNRN
ncbi:MAG: hypothetical protein IPF62_15060 [Bacteroidetes bacterium]|nr:hypothetical protein [Bacteroidota bacterium]